MCDVYIFLSTMKLSWLRRLMVDSPFVHLLYVMYPDLKNLSTLGGEFANVAMHRINNPFWVDILRHYKKISSKPASLVAGEFLGEHIHYNLHIIRDRHVVYLSEWVDNNILQIKDLVSEKGAWLTFKEV